MEALLAALAGPPAVMRRSVQAMVLFVATLAVAFGWGHRSSAGADVCANAEARLAGVWDGPRQETSSGVRSWRQESRFAADGLGWRSVEARCVRERVGSRADECL